MDAWDAESWVEGRLQLDSTLISLGVSTRVYRYEAPSGATMPFIVLGMRPDASDVVGIGVARVLSNYEFVIRAVGSVEDQATLVSIAQRFDPALEVREDNGVGCVRSNPLSYTTRENGQIYRHLGGIYRVIG